LILFLFSGTLALPGGRPDSPIFKDISMDICLSPARAAASRSNGAKSSGPKTPEGKARSAQNALKHGMRAQKCVVLPGERASAFEAFEAALLEELAPEGALQAVLAQRVVAASWRLARTERLEAELFAQNMLDGRGLGLALIRDCNNARAFDTLLRYRGGTLAELWRALRTLKGLQAQAAASAPAPTPRLLPEPQDMPIEPERRGNPGDPARLSDRVHPGMADPGPASARLPHRPLPKNGKATCVQPIEPERAQPAQAVPPAPASGRVEPGGSTAALLAGTALVPAAGGPESARAQAAWRSACSSERARLTRRPG
jgi:hypothetical protein